MNSRMIGGRIPWPLNARTMLPCIVAGSLLPLQSQLNLLGIQDWKARLGILCLSFRRSPLALPLEFVVPLLMAHAPEVTRGLLGGRWLVHASAVNAVSLKVRAETLLVNFDLFLLVCLRSRGALVEDTFLGRDRGSSGEPLVVKEAVGSRCFALDALCADFNDANNL